MTIPSGPTAVTHPEPIDATSYRAWRAWRGVFEGKPAFGALTDWQYSTAPDGRPLNTARVAGPNAHLWVEQFVTSHRFPGVRDDQPRPFLDVSESRDRGRVSCLWLLEDQWVQLWAPEPQSAPDPAPKPAPVGMSLKTADALLAEPRPRPSSDSTPSGRLPFTRRPKTRKENAA